VILFAACWTSSLAIGIDIVPRRALNSGYTDASATDGSDESFVPVTRAGLDDAPRDQSNVSVAA